MGMRLYGFWRSIATFRVRVALNLKGLAFEEVSVNILDGTQFAAGYDAVNPAHAVPTLVHDGHRLTQSLAILDYLDDIQPEPALLPRVPAERAYVRALALLTVADTHPLMVPRVRDYLRAELGADGEAVNAWVRHWISTTLSTYERLLSARPPAPFMVGETPGLADICIAGHMLSARMFAVNLALAPRVATLADRCLALPAFADAHPLRQTGAPDA